MIEKYLKLFGIKKVENLPAAFDSQYQDEWDVFRQSFKNPSKDPLRSAFYLCAEFVRYMTAIKMRPFKVAVQDPVTHLNFNVHRAYEIVFTSHLQDLGDLITEQFRKLRLSDFKVVNSKFTFAVVKSKYVFRFTVATAPTIKPLTQTLKECRNPALNAERVPVQLQNSRGLDTVATLLDSTDEYGWLKMTTLPLAVYVQRAKNDMLVFRFVSELPHEVVFGSTIETRTKILKLWKLVKIVLNCK